MRPSAYGFAVVSLAALLLLPSAARAQRASPLLETQDSALEQHHGWTPLRVAKWSALTASAAAVIYGFSQNHVADHEYASIEELCKQTPQQCTRNSSEAYVDAALEQRYQKVVTRDEHARVALLAGQLGVAASVVLFVLDMHDGSGPKDIPYEPRPLQVGVTRRGVELQFHKRTR